MSETGAVNHAGTTITYDIRRSERRRRTITITLDANGEVHVLAPMRASQRSIRDFVKRRADWILDKTEEVELRPELQFVTGEVLPYFGRQFPLTVLESRGSRVRVDLGEGGFTLTVPEGADTDDIHAALASFYRKRALEWIEERVTAWAEFMRVAPTKVLVRDQKQRWGSCSPDGTLRFNWRLAMAHPQLIDYVVAHELVHLRVRSHGPDFWLEFTRYMPDCKRRRTRLHEWGKSLPL